MSLFIHVQMIKWLRRLYEGETIQAQRFRYGLLLFDIGTVLFIIATSFVQRVRVIEWLDAVFGVLIAADLLARILVARHRWREVLSVNTAIDAVAVVSFLAPVTGEGGGFLRILRTVRLLRNFRVVARLRGDFPFFRQNEEIIVAGVNLGVFLFVMTGIVYETQHWTNPEIRNYADALYFTVTALTTTGFGDIVLIGTSGRMITVAIMIVGVTLFLRLAQVLFRPHKVRFQCPACGLQRHDQDAVHCKACGSLLNIPDEGS
jgi:voltage-gated potassium channel